MVGGGLGRIEITILILDMITSQLAMPVWLVGFRRENWFKDVYLGVIII